jgi:hypothetical protein
MLPVSQIVIAVLIYFADQRVKIPLIYQLRRTLKPELQHHPCKAEPAVEKGPIRKYRDPNKNLTHVTPHYMPSTHALTQT